MSLQAIFDKSVGGIIEQGEVSADSKNCYYRKVLDSGKVLRCAAGQLIPDSEYDPTFDKGTDTGLNTTPCIPNPASQYFMRNFNENELGFIHNLQGLHDVLNDYEDDDFMASFKEKAKNLAHMYNLEWRFD
jgi:hypothetical protein